MHDLLSIILLAIVQGLAEFLPISSSGHLVLFHAALGGDEAGLLLDIMLHVGTLAAVLFFYRRELCSLATSTWRTLRELPRRGLRGVLCSNEHSPTPLEPLPEQQQRDFRFVLQLAAASVVTAVIGLALKESVETWLRTPLAVGVALMLNAVILFVAPRRIEQRSPMTWRKMLMVGLLQGLAVTPGISRSGLTISGALAMGASAKEAARISFLLSIPAIVGALALHLRELDELSSAPWLSLSLGAAVAAVVGLASLSLLLKLLEKARFRSFSYYCAAVGAIAVAWSLMQ